MIPRYEDNSVSRLALDRTKLEHWDRVEVAVLKARASRGEIPSAIVNRIESILKEHPVDHQWWLNRDAEIKHDLNAYLDERLRWFPPELQPYWHAGLTSYDIEEPAQSLILKEMLLRVETAVDGLKRVLITLAQKHRTTPMLARTHGQEAELQSFGRRCLSWLAGLNLSSTQLRSSFGLLKFSKLSGAIGNYGGISPEVEKVALEILDLKPFYGSTQIMPRLIYQPLADTLTNLALWGQKIAQDIRLGARSPFPIFQEPFSKSQKGSSAMPHKKNPITTEQVEGLARLAVNYNLALKQGIVTWEERAIEQSCVERVAWPDLFHVVVRILANLTRTLAGLQVYPANMIREIFASGGCYASGQAKDFLKNRGEKFGLTHESAYRIVQLAAVLVHQAIDEEFCGTIPEVIQRYKATEESRMLPERVVSVVRRNFQSIGDVIRHQELRSIPEHTASEEDVCAWRKILAAIFDDVENQKKWQEIFSYEFHLRHESRVFVEVMRE